MWELDHKESWVLKNWCFWTVCYWRRLLRVPWTARRSNQCILKEISSWVFIGRTDAKAETPILWPPDMNNQLAGKDPDPGKDWRQEEKGMTEDKMASPTLWTWVWVNSGSWWWTRRPGVLQSMGLQSQTQQSDWTELKHSKASNLVALRPLMSPRVTTQCFFFSKPDLQILLQGYL